MRKYIILLTIFLLAGASVEAASVGERRTLYVDSTYDVIDRKEVSGLLQKISKRAYFYFDTNWWETLNYTEQANIRTSINNLSAEFDNNIYPNITKEFGNEWKPGIDKDTRITILIHPMKDNFAGYFNSGNEYTRLENPRSNEREMIYLGADHINGYLAKSFLAHEFLHLVTFNQKEKIHNIEEEVWLNEARAEYMPTLLGYDDNYARSNLRDRKSIFYGNSSDSLTEWRGDNDDYGIANMFIQYLVDHYGVKILSDSLKEDSVGIESLNIALKNNGFEKDFSQIFTDWTIAVLVNDCSLGEQYCYKNNSLANLRIKPTLNFLPLDGNSTLAVSQSAKNWEANWIKLIGGKGAIRLEFIGDSRNIFKVPYVIRDKSGNYLIRSISLDNEQKGEIIVDGFGSNVDSIIIIPSIQTKLSEFVNPEDSISFFWSASVIDTVSVKESSSLSQTKVETKKETPKEKLVSLMSKDELANKIAEIESLLRQLMAQLAALRPSTNDPIVINSNACSINQNLSFGQKNSSVTCLQEFLRDHGVYPEGLVTGYFGNLTQAAVIRFQEKYTNEVLAPFGLFSGTGYVGTKTRAKINNILENK